MRGYFGYKDKICPVTGCSNGIGRITCAMLLDMGTKIYGLDVMEPTNLPLENS